MVTKMAEGDELLRGYFYETARRKVKKEEKSEIGSPDCKRQKRRGRATRSVISESDEESDQELTEPPPPTPPPPPHHAQTNRPVVEQPVTATEELLLTLIAELKEEVKEVKKLCVENQRLLVMGNLSKDVPDDLLEQLKLPISSEAALNEADVKLKSDPAISKCLISTLKTKGGENVREIIKRMISFLFKNEICVKLNWTGVQNKISFNDTAFRSIVEKAIHCIPSMLDITDKDIQQEIAHFLRGASDRAGGRKQRQLLSKSRKRTQSEDVSDD